VKNHSCHIPLIVITFMGFALLISLTGTIWLVANGKDSAAVMVVSNLCSTALGGLIGVLVQTNRSSKDESQAVTVTNAPGDPVPVIAEDG